VSPDAVVEVDELVHRYGRRTALAGVTFAVGEGELFGLLGPNGGGKTTLLHVLATLLRPTGGAARVAGFDVAREPTSVRRRIGVVFQSPSLDLHLTARENLRHQGHLHGLRGRPLRARIERALARLGVTERGDDRVKTLSGGLRRRVEIAKGLLHEPRVLLLDEPTVGLDPVARREVWRHLTALRQAGGTTILLTTHLMDEAQACDRVAILDQGALVAAGEPAELVAEIRGDVILLETEDPTGLAAAIRARFGSEATAVDGVVRLERQQGATFVPRLAEAFPGEIRSITVGKPTLEDVFVQRTGHRFEEPPPGSAAAR
jgi:ABC-2 type transport system ATP-binding protein